MFRGFLWWFLDFRKFIGLELGQTELRVGHKLRRHPPGGAPCELVPLSCGVWSPPEASRVPSGPEKIILKFFFIWTSFGIDFLKSQKQAKKQELALGTRSIG